MLQSLISFVLIESLTAAENKAQVGVKRIGFSSKRVSSKYSGLGSFADEQLYDLLEEMVNTQVWAVGLEPAQRENIEGFKSIKLKIDLSYFDQIARFCGYVRHSETSAGRWLKLNEDSNLPYRHLNFTHWGESPEAALENIIKAKQLLVKNTLSRHQLSALLQQNAKILTESDLDAFLHLHPKLASNIRPRIVIVDFYATGAPKHCLIVENLDTYHYLRALLPENWMLVCGFGQRITKHNVFDPEVYDLHAHIETPAHAMADCKAVWQSREGEKLYWGDLDGKGESIFLSLKSQFTGLKKWAPAYSAMERIRSQLGERKSVNQEAVIVTSGFFTKHVN